MHFKNEAARQIAFLYKTFFRLSPFPHTHRFVAPFPSHFYQGSTHKSITARRRSRGREPDSYCSYFVLLAFESPMNTHIVFRHAMPQLARSEARWITELYLRRQTILDVWHYYRHDIIKVCPPSFRVECRADCDICFSMLTKMLRMS